MERSTSGGSCAHASTILMGSMAVIETGSRTTPLGITKGAAPGAKARVNVSSDLTLA